MQCPRRWVCTTPHAYNAPRALLNILSSVPSRRWQSTTGLEVEQDHANVSATSPRSQADDNARVYRKISRSELPNVKQVHLLNMRGARGSGPVASGAEEDASATNTSKLEALDLEMEGVLPLDMRDDIAVWAQDPVTHSSTQQRLINIAKIMGYLQHRKDGRQVDDVPQLVREYVNYEEKSFLPMSRHYWEKSPVPWQLSRAEASNVSALDRLNAEIKAFVKHFELTSGEKLAREAVVEAVLGFVRRTGNDTAFRMETFGSEKTGLALPLSDIDIRVYEDASKGLDDSDQQSTPIRPFMAKVAQAIRKNNSFDGAALRSSASYPIVRTAHRTSGLEIQIVASESSAVREGLIKDYLDSIPHLRELYLLIRMVLHIRGLLDVFYGGLGSYATFMWVVAISQTKTFKKSLGVGSVDNVASHFLAFLRCAAGMNSSVYGLSIHQGRVIEKHEMSDEQTHQKIAIIRANPNKSDLDKERAVNELKMARRSNLQPYKLFMQDPANPTNDLGQRCHAYKHIRFVMNALYLRLRYHTSEIDNALAAGRPGPPNILLEPVLGSAHEMYGAARKRLEHFGRRVEHLDQIRALQVGLHAAQRLNIVGRGRLYSIPQHKQEVYRYSGAF